MTPSKCLGGAVRIDLVVQPVDSGAKAKTKLREFRCSGFRYAVTIRRTAARHGSLLGGLLFAGACRCTGAETSNLAFAPIKGHSARLSPIRGYLRNLVPKYLP